MTLTEILDLAERLRDYVNTSGHGPLDSLKAAIAESWPAVYVPPVSMVELQPKTRHRKKA